MAPKVVRPQYMSDGLKSIIIKGIRVGSFFRVHPFYWSDEEQRLKQRHGTIDLFLHKCALAYITADFAFVATRAAQAIGQKSVDVETQIICVFFAIFQMYALILAYGMDMRRDEFPDLLNGGFTLLPSLDSRLPPARSHPKIGLPIVWIIEQLHRNFFYSLNLITLASCVLCLLRPQYPVLLSSLFKPGSEYYRASIVVSTVVQALFQLVYIPTCYILVYVGTGVTIPLIPAIKALGSKRMCTDEEIIENLRDYNKIRLFLDQFERVYLHFLVPVSQYIIIAFGTFGLVGFIRLSGSERSMLTVNGLVTYAFLMLCFGGLSSVHKGGKDVLNRWSQNYEIDQRNIRCLKPIRMNLSFYAYIDKGILLTSTDIVINTAITILLM